MIADIFTRLRLSTHSRRDHPRGELICFNWLDAHHQTGFVPALRARFDLCSRKGADWTQISRCRMLCGPTYLEEYRSLAKSHPVDCAPVAAWIASS
jgi:hypothetical protein